MASHKEPERKPRKLLRTNVLFSRAKSADPPSPLTPPSSAEGCDRPKLPAKSLEQPTRFSVGSDSTADHEESRRIHGFFAAPSLDIFGIVAYLLKTDHPNVRVFLLNQLHEMPLESVEFVLPQLVGLSLLLNEKDAAPLESFFIEKCHRSLHFTLKLVWSLQAEARTCRSKDLRHRCASLSERCEVALVNSRITESDLDRTRGHVRAHTHASILLQDTDRLAMAARRASLGSVEVKEEEAPAIVPLEAQGEDEMESKQVMYELFMAKMLRSDYFNRMLRLAETLEQTSNTLVRVPREHRPRVLRALLAHLEVDCCTGVYFPNRYLNETHYRILRLAVSEARVLNSRDKAPFMMFLETQPTHMKCSGPIYMIAGQDMPSAARVKRQSPPPKDVRAAEGIVRRFSEPRVGTDQPYKRRGSFSTSGALCESGDELGASLKEDYFSISNSNDQAIEKNASALQDMVVVHQATVPSAQAATLREAFGEEWALQKERVRGSSPFGHVEGWNLMSVIMKGGDDCRQERMAMQLIEIFHDVWREAKIPVRLRPYNVLVLSADSGLIETVPNSISLHNLKKNLGSFTTLASFFEAAYGPKGSMEHERAVNNFVESLAGYSVVCYLLQIKDRHNGNIMLTRWGHILHIDFGFILSNSPGGNINFESPPFKLTREYVELMGGQDSEKFIYFKTLVVECMLEARKHAHKIVTCVEVLLQNALKNGTSFPCFLAGSAALEALRGRFMPSMTDEECVEQVIYMVDYSVNHWRTVHYDYYQRITNDIF